MVIPLQQKADGMILKNCNQKLNQEIGKALSDKV